MPRLALIKRLFVLGVQSAHLAGLALNGRCEGEVSTCPESPSLLAEERCQDLSEDSAKFA